MHIVAYWVPVYHISPSSILVSSARKCRCVGKEGPAPCTSRSPSGQAKDHSGGEDGEGEEQRRNTP